MLTAATRNILSQLTASAGAATGYSVAFRNTTDEDDVHEPAIDEDTDTDDQVVDLTVVEPLTYARTEPGEDSGDESEVIDLSD